MENTEKLILTGMSASPGIVSGKAKLFFSGDDATKFEEGDILVTTITDPTMVQAMVKAGGIITDIGGITSHPAILSREMGIPCVVNTKKGSKTIKDGMKIYLNANTGQIYAMD